MCSSNQTLQCWILTFYVLSTIQGFTCEFEYACQGGTNEVRQDLLTSSFDEKRYMLSNRFRRKISSGQNVMYH